MPDSLFRESKASDPGLSKESLFIAKLPDLTRPWECDGFGLVWDYANLSEIGGSGTLHSSPDADQAADEDLREGCVPKFL